jgi:hypothetical protein
MRDAARRERERRVTAYRAGWGERDGDPVPLMFFALLNIVWVP